MKAKEISLGTYLVDYYTDKIYKNDKIKILMIIGWLIFSRLFVAIGLSLFTPPVYLIADRQRGILYSYGMGKVRLTRHEDAQFGYAGKMLAIKLYGIDEKQGN